jgi:hypothetical protein
MQKEGKDTGTIIDAIPGAKFVKIGEYHYEIQTEGDTLEFDNHEVGEITFGAIKSIAKAFTQKEEIANANHN